MLLLCRVGALLATGVRGPGGRYPTRECPAGVAGEGPAVGRRKEAAHRGGDLAAQGLFRAGAPPGQDLERTADSSGGEGSCLYLRAGTQQPARTPTTAFGEPFDLSNCTANVLGWYVHLQYNHPKWYGQVATIQM